MAQMTIYALILMNTTYKITKILNSDVDQTIVLTPNLLHFTNTSESPLLKYKCLFTFNLKHQKVTEHSSKPLTAPFGPFINKSTINKLG